MRRAVALCVALFAAPAAAENLVTTLSTERIAITSNFNGATLVVFGAIEREASASPHTGAYDVVTTVRGPRGVVTVREKQRWGPLWLNMEARKYIAIPAFVSVAANRPLAEIASEDARSEFLLGVDTLVSAQGDRTKSLDAEEPAFRAALIRIRRTQGLFSERSDGVKFLSPTVFRAAARIPGTVPLGAYAVDVAVLANGVQIAKSTTPFLVVKSGAEDEIAAASHNQPLAYGLVVAALALLFGWIASLIFRRD